MAETKSIKISELIPDDMNFNKGSEFGGHLIEKSFSKFGAGRSILLDKNNRIIAGNKATENSFVNGIEDVIIIETTGDKLVAVKRMDIDLDSDQGREMALADNATAKANITWDFEELENWGQDETISEWGIREPEDETTNEEEVNEELEFAEELSIEKEYLMIVFNSNEEYEEAKALLNLKIQRENAHEKISLNTTGYQRVMNYENLRTLIK